MNLFKQARQSVTKTTAAVAHPPASPPSRDARDEAERVREVNDRRVRRWIPRLRGWLTGARSR